MLRKILLAALMAASFGWGVAVGAWKVFPHDLISMSRNLTVGGPADRPRQLYTNPIAVDAGKIDAWLDARAEFIMAGDSITAAGRWQEMFPGVSIINRGVSGDTVTGLFERAPAIAAIRPRVIFVMVGINDIIGGNSNAEILPRYDALLGRLSTSGATLFVQSVLYCNTADCTPVILAQVRSLNMALRELARRHNAAFLDLNTRFAQGDRMKAEYTFDGVHLNGAGFRLWREMLQPEIARAAAAPSPDHAVAR